MADWVDLVNFSDGKVVTATPWQNMLADLTFLKNPMLAEVFAPGPNNTAFVVTTTSTWLDVDPTYFQQTVECQGNDLLVVAFMRVSHSASLGQFGMTFTLDGIAAGIGSGLFGFRDSDNIQETYCVGHIFSGVSAGSHLLKVQVNNQTTGNAELWLDPCLPMAVIEL